MKTEHIHNLDVVMVMWHVPVSHTRMIMSTAKTEITRYHGDGIHLCGPRHK